MATGGDYSRGDRNPRPVTAMKRSLPVSFFLLLGAAGAQAQSGVFAGPFFPSSGTYNTIPGGTFEVDDPLTGWFSLNNGAPISSVEAPSMRGDRIGSMVSATTGHYASMKPLVNSLVAGQTYVLSGFFRTDDLGGAIGFDIGNYGGQAWYQTAGIFQAANAQTTGDWFFAYTTFTADNPSMTVRLVRSSETVPYASNYFDDIAVTPVGSFVAPAPVPEPGTFALVGIGALAALKRRRRS